MRGRLIFPFLAELHRLDPATMATVPPGYDEDFREPALLDAAGDGVATPPRQELPPMRVPCQVEPQTLEALRMMPSGNAPESRLELVFHFRDLERLGLVNSATGETDIRCGERLSALYDTKGALVLRVRTPPGLYATEVRQSGFGLSRGAPSRNLLVVSFSDRPLAPGA